jgi:hypothetical protein
MPVLIYRQNRTVSNRASESQNKEEPMKKKSLSVRWALGFLFLIVISASPIGAAEFHVTDAAQFQNALDASQSNGQDDTIYLIAGIYEGNFAPQMTEPKQLTLKGEPGTTAEDVVLGGLPGGGAVLSLENLSGAVNIHVEGVTIQHGTKGGVNAWIKNGSLKMTLNNVIIQHNTALDHGGGVQVNTYENASAELTIINCIIRYNQATDANGQGGGIHAMSCYGNSNLDLLMVDTLIYKNTAYMVGGGVNLIACEWDNDVVQGKIVNSTITANTVENQSPGGGIRVQAYNANGTRASLDLYNTIVYGNITEARGKDLYVLATSPATAEVNALSCNINDVYLDNGLYFPANVINADPLFLDPVNDNYHLTKDSPCIDSGTSSIPSPPGLPEEDLDGNPRVNGPLPDIGAYEFGGLSVSPDEGTIGTEIEIYGSGFGTKKNKILIGTTALKVLQWTDGWIRASLIKALAPGLYDLTIQPKGASSILLEGAFTVKVPEILSVEPGTGSFNEEITIHGFFFGNKRGKVTLGGKNCRIKSWTSEIHFVVPRGLSAGTYELKITNGVGSDTTNFIVE